MANDAYDVTAAPPGAGPQGGAYGDPPQGAYAAPAPPLTHDRLGMGCTAGLRPRKTLMAVHHRKRRMAGLRRKGLTAMHSRGLTAMLIKAPMGKRPTARRKAQGARKRSG